jgi:hypothetical protein
MKYFKEEEFVCKCPGLCKHKFVLAPEVAEALDHIRGILGTPISVTSGTRCPEWNAKQGGATSSAHLQKGQYSWAVDVSCPDSAFRYAFLRKAFKIFNRIGIADTFIHVDMDPNNAPAVVWLY